jgi:hypothetical protein
MACDRCHSVAQKNRSTLSTTKPHLIAQAAARRNFWHAHAFVVYFFSHPPTGPESRSFERDPSLTNNDCRSRLVAAWRLATWCIRGRAVLVCVFDECAFYKDETSATPDTELYAAIGPATLTLRDQSMLIGISTPHKKSGLLWNKFQKSYGKDDPNVLVATSLQLNPTLPVDEIEAEIAADPDLKRAEYLCEWRTDISSFVSPEIVDAAIERGKQVISPQGQAAVGYIDVSGGVHDAHDAKSGHRHLSRWATGDMFCSKPLNRHRSLTCLQRIAAAYRK